jgi:hypothetical protein
MSKEKQNNYSYLLTIIVDSVPNKKDREFIQKNMDEIIDNLVDFSKYMSKIVEISSGKDSETNKIKKLKALEYNGYSLSQKEAKEVLKMLSKTSIQAGGDAKALLKNVAKGMATQAAANAIANSPNAKALMNNPLAQLAMAATPQGQALANSQLGQMAMAATQQPMPQDTPQQDIAVNQQPMAVNQQPIAPPIVYQQPPMVQQFAQMPQQAIQYANMAQQLQQQNPGGIMSSFMGLFGMANLVYNDYQSSLDWVYILLFLLAQIPFIGFIPNAVIIFRALKDGRTFLAILNTITTFFSIFTLHTIDMGFAIKAIYALDVYSNAKYPNK